MSPKALAGATLCALAWVMSWPCAAAHASFEAGWLDYDALETAPSGFQLDRERGDLAAAALSLGSEQAWGGWTVQAVHGQGDLEYRGISQFGIPLRTTTSLKIDRIALQWEPPWEPRVWRIALRPRIRISRQVIDRAVHASIWSTRLTEKLDTTDAAIGLRLQMPLNERWRVTLVAEALRPLRQRLDVDTFGTYDNFVLVPRARTSRQMELGVSRGIGDHWRAGVWVVQEHRRYGSSPSRVITRNGAEVGAANYPGSLQKIRGVAVRAEYGY